MFEMKTHLFGCVFLFYWRNMYDKMNTESAACGGKERYEQGRKIPEEERNVLI